MDVTFRTPPAATRARHRLMPMFFRTGRFLQASRDRLARPFGQLGETAPAPDLHRFVTEAVLPAAHQDAPP